MEFKCKDRLRLGFFLRVLVTCILLLSIDYLDKDKKYLLLLLVFKIIILDSIDSVPTLLYKGNKDSCWNPCTQLFYYQKWDKIVDLFSYLLLYIALDYDIYLLILIIWRIIGISLFAHSKNRGWLVPFFDFIKEYLLYLYFFGNNFKYIPIFFIAKIFFEYYFHVYRFKHNRCLNEEIRS